MSLLSLNRLTLRGSRSSRGASAVEFALLLLPLALITFGIIDFGIMLYNQQVLTNASREGARAGIVAPASSRLPYDGVSCSCATKPCSIECVVKDYAESLLVTFGGSGNLGFNYDPAYSVTQSSGTALTVDVTYDYYFLAISGLANLGPKITLHGTTVMRYE